MTAPNLVENQPHVRGSRNPEPSESNFASSAVSDLEEPPVDVGEETSTPLIPMSPRNVLFETKCVLLNVC